MENKALQAITKMFSEISEKQIKQVIKLIEDGNTIPFIARYRKELTGNLDEVQIADIKDSNDKINKLFKRQEEVINQISDSNQLTDELRDKILKATTMQQVEDLYLPYKQKRKTKAMIAKEKGLDNFANWILTLPKSDLNQEAKKYLNTEFEINSIQDVLDGAHEIIAEKIGNEAEYRSFIRKQTRDNGLLRTKVKTKGKEIDEKGVYQDYYDYEQKLKKIPGYRVLAINRGEKEKVLRVKVEIDFSVINKYLSYNLLKGATGSASEFIESAYQDAYSRFIAPAIEREIRNEMTEQAEAHAIDVFGNNLYHLLMQSPLKGKVVMGFDPAYRTGCKLAIIDQNGSFIHKEIIYPTKPSSEVKQKEAMKIFINLIEQYQVEMVAIGNGTASRESEIFVSEALKKINQKVYYVIVNEAGASVYSASKNARTEFPELHVEERSAISIGRRLQDPLAELIKIDPKSVGVGQYQHDVSQKELDHKLDRIVEMVVNNVGVDLNTASAELLEHIAGLSKTTAKNIVQYRQDNGGFTNRVQLKKVAKLGPKTYEQAIGFLRILDGSNPLDNTDIHPESYPLAQSILEQQKINLNELNSKIDQINLNQVDYENLDANKLTISEIVNGLNHFGRDSRDEMPAPLLKSDILTMEDLKEGMKMQGTVRNVTDFGVFVDIGVKQDGLVHISKMSNQFIDDPSKIASVGDIVDVWIDQVDLDRGRIQLSMIAPKG